MSEVGNDAIILDSYALLAYLGNEIGGDRVREILDQAQRADHRVYLSLINLGEIAYIVERHRGTNAARETIALIRQLPIEIVEVNQGQVSQPHIIKQITHSHIQMLLRRLSLNYWMALS